MIRGVPSVRDGLAQTALVISTTRVGERSTKAICLAMAMLVLIASGAEARIIDWQAELERCRALRENMAPLLLAGEGTSGVARSGRAARRCMWIEHRAARKGITGVDTR
ncbi:hypothetical protein [Bradyrhizobium sp. UFLA05-112]